MGLGTVSQTDLLTEMEQYLPEGITKADARKVLAALAEAVPAIIADGYAVSVAALVKLDPVGVPKRTVMALREFGNADSGRVKKVKPSDIKVKATTLKRVKDAKPSKTGKAGKDLISVAQQRYDEAVKRREEREAQAVKDAAKEEREAKRNSGGSSRSRTPARAAGRR